MKPLIFLLPLVWLAPASAQEARFHPLGSVPGSIWSKADAISADRTTVVGTVASPNGQFAFRWTAATGTRLLPVQHPFFFVEAAGVSADGASVIGGVWGSEFSWGFLWTEAGGEVTLITPFNQFVSVLDVDATGTVVIGGGSSYWPEPSGAFRWTSTDGTQLLGDLGGGSNGTAWGINADGTVIVGAVGSPLLAFRWTAATGMVSLGTLPSHPQRSAATAISSDGELIVGWSGATSGNVVCLWNGSAGILELGSLAGFPEHHPSGISANGAVVVGTASQGNSHRAFLWTAATGVLDLREVLVARGVGCLDGWILERANGVSDDGLVIAGTGFNPAGAREAWVAYLDGATRPSIGARYCTPAATNSTGLEAELSVRGWTCHSDGELTVSAERMPPGKFGMFLTSLDTDLVTPLGSQGNLCLGGNLVRLQPVFLIDASGGATLDLDLATNPFSPGTTWHLQAWFRDSNPTPTSNLTDAVAVPFR